MQPAAATEVTGQRDRLEEARFVAVVATTNAKDHGSQNTAPATVHYQQQWH